MKTDELREKYLAFFETKGCVRRPSDVLVPRWDPSVLFTPAGMNQFKDHFLGRCKLDFTRATTCQKCLRTGDIDNVGRTAYHHTFFEMLGNFSFGDYFKREAIHWAWEFLTSKKWLGLDPERLSATVYLDDDEAADIWLDEIKLPPRPAQAAGRGRELLAGQRPQPRARRRLRPVQRNLLSTRPSAQVEIWNLVFTQFNRVGDPPDNLRPLPSKNIDTGMGLERTAVGAARRRDELPHRHPAPAGRGGRRGLRRASTIRPSENGRRLRRIADHVRACTFAIHENVYPGNEEAGLRHPPAAAPRGARRPPDGRPRAVPAQLVPAGRGRLDEEPVSRTAAKRSSASSQRDRRMRRANFFERIDAGLDRIERLFEQMKKRASGTVSGARGGRHVPDPRLPARTVRDPGRRARTWPSTGRAFKRRWSSTASSRAAGRKSNCFEHGPLDALRRRCTAASSSATRRSKSPTASVMGIIANDRTLRPDRRSRPRAIRSRSCSTRRRSTARWAAKWATRARSSARACRFEVIDTQIDGRLHAARRPSPRRPDRATATRSRARSMPTRRQGIRRAHSATHLLALRPAKALWASTPAAGLEGRRRPAAVRLRQLRRPSRRGACGRSRTRSTPAMLEAVPVGWTLTAAWPRPARPAP